MAFLKSFTLRWTKEQLEETTIEGVKAMRLVSHYDVEDEHGKPIELPGGRLHGSIAITPGPNETKRLEDTMMACAKNIESILVEAGLFSLDPTVKTFGLEVQEG